MERKTLKDFHKQLSWSTRIYTLLTIVLVAGAFLFDAWSTNWALAMVLAVAVVLLVESFAVSFHRHPRTWRIIRWILILILMGLLFISNG
jgi:hypothetical protein